MDILQHNYERQELKGVVKKTGKGQHLNQMGRKINAFVYLLHLILAYLSFAQ